jgi:hypothetical protein
MSKKRKDQAYLDWLSYQSSCLDGTFSEYDTDGRGRCVACHVRRSANSGTAFKPEYSAVPMTDKQHQLQGSGGELACLQKYYHSWECPQSVVTAKEWFENKAERYLNIWKMQNKIVV